VHNRRARARPPGSRSRCRRERCSRSMMTSGAGFPPLVRTHRGTAWSHEPARHGTGPHGDQWKPGGSLHYAGGCCLWGRDERNLNLRGIR
jgi:hypothetical protein